ncbi:MAG: ATP-binding protein [Planctomycetota bacterium]
MFRRYPSCSCAGRFLWFGFGHCFDCRWENQTAVGVTLDDLDHEEIHRTREDRLSVPADALREVILNAVMHRDYSNPGGDISITGFDDRIEISSYGNLLPGVTPELLSGPHKSILRNPLIAQTFHRTGAVETWGRVISRNFSWPQV